MTTLWAGKVQDARLFDEEAKSKGEAELKTKTN